MLRIYSNSLSLIPVFPGGGREEFLVTWAEAALLAISVKTVCGASRFTKGTTRLPSIAHSVAVLGPKSLRKNYVM